MSSSNTSSNSSSSSSSAARLTASGSLPLSQTTFAPPRWLSKGYLLPVNTAAGGLACTLNTRYEAMALPLDILSLAHYPKTVILIEWFL